MGKMYGPGFVWVHVDDLVEDCLLDVQVAETDRGWVITDLCLSLAPPESVRDHIVYDEPGPRSSDFSVYEDEGTPPKGITSKHLQQLKLQAIRIAVAESLAPDDFEDEEWARRAAELVESMTGTKHRQRDDLYYATLAALYVEVTRTKKRRIYDEMAKQVGYAPSTLADAIKEARRRGLLTTPIEGRSGGKLTSKAKDLLERNGR
jgi:hypothetical protein